MTDLTLEQKDNFLRNKKKVSKTILKILRKEDATIFGAKSVNVQVKPHLRSPTEDFDIFVKGNPKQTARRIERRLDKKFGGNFFKVEEGKFEGVFKVKSRLSGKGLIDIQKQKEKVGIVKRKGNKFANLEFQKKKIKESLANPEAEFRRDKDKFSRLRIKLNTRAKPKSRKITKKKRTFKRLNNNIFERLNF